MVGTLSTVPTVIFIFFSPATPITSFKRDADSFSFNSMSSVLGVSFVIVRIFLFCIVPVVTLEFFFY